MTTNIQEDGKRISIHNLGKNQSETARKQIEDKYGLVKAGSTHIQRLHTNLNKAVYGKSETKKTMDNIVGQVMKRYKFSSLTEFNAVLRQYNVMADRGKEGMIMFNKNGLLYSMLDTKGNKIGVQIKASALLCKPTLKNLEAHFQSGSALKQAEKERLANIVDSFFRETNRPTRINFCNYMTLQGINAVFRENKEGRVYGLTFIDNKSGAVFNGSHLGKCYSGQVLIKKFETTSGAIKLNETERDDLKPSSSFSPSPSSSSSSSSSSAAAAHRLNDNASQFLKIALTPEHSRDEAIDPAFKKRKKKKGRSI